MSTTSHTSTASSGAQTYQTELSQQSDPYAQPPQHPRESSLVHRCEAHHLSTSALHRVRPRAYDHRVWARFSDLNGVLEGECWVSGQDGVQWAHMVPHSEAACSRLILWLQLSGLLPINARERMRAKMSYTNLLPVNPNLHSYLSDNRKRRALIRPTRRDLHLLVSIVERYLASQTHHLGLTGEDHWSPRWPQLLALEWPSDRKENFDGERVNSYEYQVDFFDLRRNSIPNVRHPSSSTLLREVEGGPRCFPNALQVPLPEFQAPLCILTMVAYSVSQARFVSEVHPDVVFERDFVEDLDVMSYIVHLLGSAQPDHYTRILRPLALPFSVPLTVQLAQHPGPRRDWPLVSPVGSADRSAPSAAEFSSSPHRGVTKLASSLFNMRTGRSILEAEEQPEHGEDDTSSGEDGGSDADDDGTDSEGSWGAGDAEMEEDVEGRSEEMEVGLMEGEEQRLTEEEGQIYQDLATHFFAELQEGQVVSALVESQRVPLSTRASLRKVEKRWREIVRAIPMDGSGFA